MVWVYCLATDPERLRAFAASDALAQAMHDSGVTDEPTIIVMQPMSRDLVSGRLLPGIIVMHEVRDYDAWRVVYDELDEYRRASGIVGLAVCREYVYPNQIIVYHQAEEVESLRAFVDSTELNEAMVSAGVVREPDVHFIRVVGFSDY